MIRSHRSPHADSSSEDEFRLTWIGPADGSCAALLQRVQSTCAVRNRPVRVHVVEPGDASLTSDSELVVHADRVIIACETRLDYPWREIELLEHSAGPAPWGVVTGSWHAGSRRTGIGTVTHWQLPWYRWWEGWYGWCFPELARAAARCATQFQAVTLPIDLATPGESPLPQSDRPANSGREPARSLLTSRSQHILIVATCRETLQGWQLSAATAGWESLTAHPRELEAPASPTSSIVPEGILWDDSCQDRLPGGDSRLNQACRQIDWLKGRYAGVPIVAAVSESHLSCWAELQRAGTSDFIVKPSFGLPLADYLVARAMVGQLRLEEETTDNTGDT